MLGLLRMTCLNVKNAVRARTHRHTHHPQQQLKSYSSDIIADDKIEIFNEERRCLDDTVVQGGEDLCSLPEEIPL